MEVDSKQAVPRLAVHVGEGADVLHQSGIGDGPADPAHLGDRLLHCRDHPRLVGDVDLLADHPRRVVAEDLRREVEAIADEAPFREVLSVELLTQNRIFELSRSSYIRLIFDINLQFASRRLRLAETGEQDAPDPHFTRKWRGAKLIELGAIAEGSRELAALAARYSRKVWQQKVGVRISELARIGEAAA